MCDDDVQQHADRHPDLSIDSHPHSHSHSHPDLSTSTSPHSRPDLSTSTPFTPPSHFTVLTLTLTLTLTLPTDDAEYVPYGRSGESVDDWGAEITGVNQRGAAHAHS